jgi:hypothetical protein
MPNYSFGNQIPYTDPYALLILGSPFIKKKSEDYASVDEKLRVAWFVSGT